MNTIKNILIFLERLTSKKRFWFFLIIIWILAASAGSDSNEPYKVDTKRENFEYKLIKGPETSENRILSIPIEGVILDRKSQASPLTFLQESVTYGEDVKEMLKRAAEDDKVKGVLIEINSPGGTVTGSKAISDGIDYFRTKTKKPIVAYISGAGLSGGYWSAVAGDQIVAESGSLIGSIGVILGPFKQYNKVTDEADASGSVGTRDGIDTIYFTAGKYKDTGSAYRPITTEETQHWQSVVNSEYVNFVNHVVTRRKFDKNHVENTVKALPYDTRKAKELGLIDMIGDQEVALRMLIEKAGLKGKEYQFLREKSNKEYLSSLFAAFTFVTKPQVQSSCNLCGKPLYLYDPSYTVMTKY